MRGFTNRCRVAELRIMIDKGALSFLLPGAPGVGASHATGSHQQQLKPTLLPCLPQREPKRPSFHWVFDCSKEKERQPNNLVLSLETRTWTSQCKTSSRFKTKKETTQPVKYGRVPFTEKLALPFLNNTLASVALTFHYGWCKHKE